MVIRVHDTTDRGSLVYIERAGNLATVTLDKTRTCTRDSVLADYDSELLHLIAEIAALHTAARSRSRGSGPFISATIWQVSCLSSERGRIADVLVAIEAADYAPVLEYLREPVTLSERLLSIDWVAKINRDRLEWSAPEEKRGG